MFCIALSFPINLYAARRLTKGLPNTFHIRIKALQDTLVYSLSYSLHFLVIGTAYFISWKNEVGIDMIDSNPSSPSRHRLESLDRRHDELWRCLFAISVSSLGAMDGFVWIWRKWAPLKEEVSMNLLCCCCCCCIPCTRSDGDGNGWNEHYGPNGHDADARAPSHRVRRKRRKRIQRRFRHRGSSTAFSTSPHERSRMLSQSRSRFQRTSHTLQPAHPDRIFMTPVHRDEDGMDEEWIGMDDEEDDDTLLESPKKKKRSRKVMADGNYRNDGHGDGRGKEKEKGCCGKMWARFGVQDECSSNTINMALRREVVAYTVCFVLLSAVI